MIEENEKIVQSKSLGKRMVKGALIFLCIMLLLCVVKIFQMQYCSILAECQNKSLRRYEKVLLAQSWWVATERLDRKDLVRLYFILGSTRKYDPDKHPSYTLEGDNLIIPHIAIVRDRFIAESTDIILWDCENNTLYIGGGGRNEKDSTRYYIDQRHAKVLREMYDKYNRLENAM